MNSQALAFEAPVEILLKTQSPGPHPPPDELIAYSEDQLAEDARQRLAGHLALCSRCTETVLDLCSFPEIPLRSGAAPRPGAAWQDWPSLRATLEGEGGVVSPRPAFSGFRQVLKMAACLLVGVLAMAPWVYRLDRQLSQPSSAVFVQNLSDSRSVTRGAGSPIVTRVPAGMDRILWLLPYLGGNSFAAYQAEIAASEDGRSIVWSGALSEPADGVFVLQVPRDYLSAGNYVIRVFGIREGTRSSQPLASYQTRVEYPSG